MKEKTMLKKLSAILLTFMFVLTCNLVSADDEKPDWPEHYDHDSKSGKPPAWDITLTKNNANYLYGLVDELNQKRKMTKRERARLSKEQKKHQEFLDAMKKRREEYYPTIRKEFSWKKPNISSRYGETYEYSERWDNAMSGRNRAELVDLVSVKKDDDKSKTKDGKKTAKTNPFLEDLPEELQPKE